MATAVPKRVQRIGMTLDIQEGKIDEYKRLHDEQWPEVRHALESVGVTNLSLWSWENRLFFYAEYVGEEPFEVAMEQYSKMPRVQEWEELMHNYQKQLPGSKPDVWWQRCTELFHQP
mmetsp:Transcript_17281/g.37287  ORF Transcript_17281/g.37287 Transcript_17281/m.37287 type:complete len:117 (-) Transcript_17281:737-1087(-)